jgi:DNA-binding LacI/PurR family transcriptional regulator
MPVGIKEIASDLNLGLSTVAQALGGRGTISARTRRLVVEHAAKLGYTPNRNAQRMRNGRTGVIGLIVPDVVLSPYVEVVEHLFRQVEDQRKELQIALTEFDDALEDRAIRNMMESRVDGMIIKVGFGRWEDVPARHYLRRAEAEKLPIILYSNPIAGIDLPYMKHPLQPSAKLIIRHLVSLGHRRIAALVPAAKPFGPAMQAWLTVMLEELAAGGSDAELEIVGLVGQDAGLEGPRGVFRDYMNQNHPRHAVQAGRKLFQQAMALDHPVTAMVAYSDPVAIGAVFEAQAKGLRVGRDIGIAGSGQMPSSFFCPISLTTVDRRPQLYAEKLLGLLSAHLNPQTRSQAPRADEVEPLLIVGESTVGG